MRFWMLVGVASIVAAAAPTLPTVAEQLKLGGGSIYTGVSDQYTSLDHLPATLKRPRRDT